MPHNEGMPEKPPLSDSALIIGALFVACTTVALGFLADLSAADHTAKAWNQAMVAAAAPTENSCLKPLENKTGVSGSVDFECLNGCTYVVETRWLSAGKPVNAYGTPKKDGPPGVEYYQALMGKPIGPVQCSGSVRQTAQNNFADLRTAGLGLEAGTSQTQLPASLGGSTASNVPLSSVINNAKTGGITPAYTYSKDAFGYLPTGQAPSSVTPFQSRYDLNPTSNIWGTISNENSLSKPIQSGIPSVPNYDTNLQPKTSDYASFLLPEPSQLQPGTINTDLSSSLVREENISQHLGSQELANWDAQNSGIPPAPAVARAPAADEVAPTEVNPSSPQVPSPAQTFEPAADCPWYYQDPITKQCGYTAEQIKQLQPTNLNLMDGKWIKTKVPSAVLAPRG